MLKTYITTGLVIAAGFISGCSDNTSKSVEKSILFEPCEDVSELDCGVFEVPLIHDSTDSRELSIDIVRLPGTGDGPHEPLLLNIGGPGPGTEGLREFVQSGLIPFALRKRYDIIAFDQRGVGHSLQVDCDELGNAESIRYPRDQSDVMTIVDDFTMLADTCSAEYTDQLQWVGSHAVVQDMEVMRAMLNAPKLNIIGSSFGTRITSLYLERFPDSSGRIILDAPLRPNGKIDTLMLETTAAQQGSFDLVLNACGTVLPDCDRSVVEMAFVARVNSLLDNAELDTFKAFFNLLQIAIGASDIGELIAPLLIDYVNSGNPADMFEVIQQFDLEEEDGNDGITLERAVLCADDAARPSVESLVSKLEVLNESSDMFAEAILPLAASCVGWPEALQPVADIRSNDAPASLVIGGAGDVRTPINWAVETAEAVGGVFITSGHQGHTTLFNHENACVDSIVVDFLIEDTLPAEGTSCH